MFRFGFRLWMIFNRVSLVLGALLIALILGGQSAERYGDRLQVALPLVAYACAITDRKGSELMARFAAVFVASHASKRLLGETAINTRPSGGPHGFPSAHSAAASFGASALVHDCLPKVPVVQAAVILAAGFVGSSRIDAGKHDIWQVLAGWILGWGGERALRRDTPARRRVIAALKASVTAARSGLVAAHARLSQAAEVALRLVLLATPLALAMVLASPTHAETELSFYGGVQGVAASDITDATGTQSVTWLGKSFEAPPYYGLRLTRWGPNGWGYGLDFNHAKAYADNPASYGYDRLEFTDGLNIVTLNLWRRWTAGQMGFAPYVGIGAGVAVPHVDVTPAGGLHTFGYQLTGPALQAVVGLRCDLSPRWSVFGEIKTTYSRHKADLDGAGTLKTDLTTGAVNLGLNWRF